MAHCKCDQCQVLIIQGTPCHETGCPNHWIDPATGEGYSRACKWCGSNFLPKDRNQRFCCEDCREDYE